MMRIETSQVVCPNN